MRRSSPEVDGPDGPQQALVRIWQQLENDPVKVARFRIVTLREDLFRALIGRSVVEISAEGEQHGLRVRCSSCPLPCEHQGAALSLILEEKMALGLSAPPPDRTPVESLSAAELIERALSDRLERARVEKMSVDSLDSTSPWADYTVTSKMSGKTYRVALRGLERGDSYCSCPDFRKTTLGTCKHILHVIESVKPRFSAKQWLVPYVPDHIFVHLHYGEDLELRLVAPSGLDGAAARVLRPLTNRSITDFRELLHGVSRLEQLAHSVTIYPDAEEFINHGLYRERMAQLVAEIRRDPAGHPLRTELLKTALLPYQLDGVAFAAGALDPHADCPAAIARGEKLHSGQAWGRKTETCCLHGAVLATGVTDSHAPVPLFWCGVQIIAATDFPHVICRKCRCPPSCTGKAIIGWS